MGSQTPGSDRPTPDGAVVASAHASASSRPRRTGPGAVALAALLAPVLAIRETRGNPALARVQLSFAAMMIATWAYTVGVTVYAFGQGGAAAVALAVVLRTLPSAVAGAPIGALADRRPRATIIRAAGVGAAVAVGASAALVAAGGPALAVYALGLAVTVAGMAFRTAQSAMLPSLTRNPRELASANVLTAAIEGGGVFAGPALGALLLALGGVTAVFIAGAALFVAATAAVVGLRTAPAGGPAAEEAGLDAGLRAIARDATVRLVLGLVLAQTLVNGALTVLYALVALELLGLGDSGVGLLTAAFGLGGLLGALATFSLAGTRRLAGVLAAGLVLWGVPLVVIGVTGTFAPTLVLLVAAGVGNVLFDVAAVTLLQRAVPDAVLARVFGALETVIVVGLGLGSLSAPVVAEAFGIDGALVAFGLLLPVLGAASARALRRVDRRARVPAFELGVLRRLPLVAGLPAPVLENLAFHAARVPVAAGTRVISEGDVGDRFYAVASGRMRVFVDGVEKAPLGPGDGFGEIALLRDVPRTATVVAAEDGLLVALDRAPFLAAVAGDPGTSAGANAIVATRMGAGVSPRAV